ncbi:MAG TPA: molybdate ABC transporter substrate-binding protein [Methanosarcinales archaeon]|nr:molybdate ABC transporter substrate-binding protein [Methanosarcinales archaeon]
MKRTAILVVAILFCSAIALGCVEEGQEPATTTNKTSGELTHPATEGPHSLLVYCGAGMRKPMDEIGSLFEEEYGISIDYNYAGSNTLLSQMDLLQNGDVYMPGATYYFDIAKEKGITDYEQRIAYHVPVIAVPRGNPAGITSLADLAKPGVTVILGDPKAAAIGKLGDKILEKNGIYDAVANNTISRGATVNELIVYTSMKQADASIIWGDLVVASEKMELVEIPREQNIIKIIPIGTLMFSEKKDTATKFVDFVASPEGKAIFGKHGFTTYPDEKYEGKQQ